MLCLLYSKAQRSFLISLFPKKKCDCILITVGFYSSFCLYSWGRLSWEPGPSMDDWHPSGQCFFFFFSSSQIRVLLEKSVLLLFPCYVFLLVLEASQCEVLPAAIWRHKSSLLKEESCIPSLFLHKNEKVSGFLRQFDSLIASVGNNRLQSYGIPQFMAVAIHFSNLIIKAITDI